MEKLSKLPNSNNNEALPIVATQCAFDHKHDP